MMENQIWVMGILISMPMGCLRGERRQCSLSFLNGAFMFSCGPVAVVTGGGYGAQSCFTEGI